MAVSNELLFTLCNLYVLPFWALLILLPGWSGTRRIVSLPLILLPLPLAYAVLIVPQLGALVPALADPELAVIAQMLSEPETALIAWIHFLAFDLLAGRWIYLDSVARGIRIWFLPPILFCTLMVGPVGLLLYLGLIGLRTLRGPGQRPADAALRAPDRNA